MKKKVRTKAVKATKDIKKAVKVAADLKQAAVNMKKAAKSPKDAKKAVNVAKEVIMALKAAADVKQVTAKSIIDVKEVMKSSTDFCRGHSTDSGLQNDILQVAKTK